VTAGRGESCIRPLFNVRHFWFLKIPRGDQIVNPGDHEDRPYSGDGLGCGTAEGSLGRVVQAFKLITTNEYISGVQNRNWPRFDGKLWQRDYYERVIRDDDELEEIREYIIRNPSLWKSD
jgi:putative transposase